MRKAVYERIGFSFSARSCHTGNAIWRSVCGSDVRRSLFVRRPPDGGTPTDRRFRLELIDHSYGFSTVRKRRTGMSY